ncbi:MAG: efflux RND transporter periplasmic adaptor subunit [Candidatus Binatia bacterium]
MLRVVAGVSVAALLLGGCSGPAGSSGAPSGPPPVAVEVVEIPRESIVDVVDLVGQLEAEESVMMTAETSGVIETVGFSEGEEVKAGALLFQLRDAEERAKLREAEARLRLAEDEHRRIHALAEQKTVSPSELDRATASLEAARARRDLAAVELERMAIRAPFDGVTGSRQVSPGDRVNKSTPLVRIDAVARLRLLFTVPEIAMTAMRVGTPLSVTFAPFPGEPFSGEVYFVAPTLDPANRRLLLKAFVPNPERRLRPGLFANIQLELARHDDALVIPESAAAYDADGVFVWRVGADHTAERVPVTLGIRRGGRVEVAGGLRAGDRIVSAGTHKVGSGVVLQDVAPVPPLPPTAARPAGGVGGAGQ